MFDTIGSPIWVTWSCYKSSSCLMFPHVLLCFPHVVLCFLEFFGVRCSLPYLFLKHSSTKKCFYHYRKCTKVSAAHTSIIQSGRRSSVKYLITISYSIIPCIFMQLNHVFIVVIGLVRNQIWICVG